MKIAAETVDIRTRDRSSISIHESYTDFPESELAQEQVISLPMYPELTEEQVRRVVVGIRDAIDGQRA